MSKRRDETLPASEMTSMIDIIFQLLIFFLVTLALGTVQDRATSKVQGEMKVSLPELPPVEKLADTPELTEGFLLHIDKDDEDKVSGDLLAYILDPEYPTVDDAEKDSTHSRGPFTLKDATRKLKKTIDDMIYLGEEPPNLEIRADESTPFGEILDIMSFCNLDSIETVNFHFAKVREGSE